MSATPEIHQPTTPLQARAGRLRRQATSLPPMLAATYRRRAAELDLQAWLEAVFNPPVEGLPAVDPKAA